MAEHDPPEQTPPKVMSADLRVQIIEDSVGTMADGKWRERLRVTALKHIRDAELIAEARGAAAASNLTGRVQ
jgi:hypothetical protein